MKLQPEIYPVHFTAEQIISLSDIANRTQQIIPRLAKASNLFNILPSLNLENEFRDFDFMLSQALNSRALYNSFAIQALILKLTYLFELARPSAMEKDYLAISAFQILINSLTDIYTIQVKEFISG